MKRDFLKELGLETEVIDKIMTENGKDIEKEKALSSELNTKLSAANDKISGYEKQISEFDTKNKNADEIQKAFDSFKAQVETEKAEAERQQKEKETETEYTNRFNTILGENTKFVNDLTKEGIYRRFKEALADAKNKGKGDKEIYEMLTKDEKGNALPGIFANPNPDAGGYPPFGNGGGGNDSSDSQFYASFFEKQK